MVRKMLGYSSLVGVSVGALVISVSASGQFAGFGVPTTLQDASLLFQFDLTLVDLDMDGDKDIVVSRTQSGSLGQAGIWLNDGTGNYTMGTSQSVGNVPIKIASGRLDMDADADVVTANRDSGDISILLSNGNGTLAPEVFLTTGGVAPHDLQIADLNNDGKGDIAVVNRDSNTVSVFWGDGGGTSFPTGSTVSTKNLSGTVGLGPRGLVVVDLNLDGKLDMVTANTTDNTLTVLYNAGSKVFIDGEFATFLNTGMAPIDVESGDWNKDGFPDIAVALAVDDAVQIFQNNAIGAFPSFTSVATIATGVRPIGLAVGDVDSDGDDDIVTMNESGNSMTVILRDPVANTWTPTTTPVPYLAPQTPRMGDVDGDGDLDLAAVNFSSFSVGVYLNGENLLSLSCLGDLNNDGIINGADLGLLLGGWGACPP
jgi:large repetitive protein